MKAAGLFATLLLCLLQACATIDTDNTSTDLVADTTLGFAEKILSIEREVVDLTAGATDLGYSTTYVEIYENPDAYFKNALDFIADTIHTLQQKQIAAYVMGNLSVDKYVRHASTAYHLFKAGTIPEQLLAQIIYYQYPSPSNKIVVNYHHNGVKQLLTEIKNENLVSESFRVIIEKILSGELLESHKATL